MSPTFERRSCRGALPMVLSGALVLLPVAPVSASNGLNLVGFGAESLGLGSADIPVSRDANAVNINPAGLTQIVGSRADAYVVPFYLTHFKHSDAFNDEYVADNPVGAFASAAYARQALHPDLRLGIGMFTSGGTGINYDRLATPFGTRDEYSAVLAITKIASAAGWRVNERLSLGLGVNMTYAAARQKLFPRTSSAGADPDSPSDDFYGLRVDGADGLSWNLRLGMQYKPTDTLTLGASYATETDLRLRNGTATFNFTPLGLGGVKYRDVRIDGFALAQELGGGVAWQFHPRWMLAVELTWLDWSHALRDATLTATRPEDEAAPARIAFAQTLNFKDQNVYGLGLEYRLSPRTVLRGGFNHGSNPIPNASLSPALNLTADREFEAGFAHRLERGWELAATLQVQAHKKERYNNPQQPFGPAVEDYGLAAVTIQLGRSW